MQTLDPRTPVLVGVGAVTQRAEAGSGLEPWRLMEKALRDAAADAGADALLANIDQIAVPRGMWPYTDPARLLADAVGARAARTVMAEIGILQQTLFSDACEGIRDGALDVAVVVGGEARQREQLARRAGLEAPLTQQEGVVPDRTLRPEDELWSPIETSAGLGMPVGYYAILESALRAREGLSIDAHRDRIAALYSEFSVAAADNPDAWLHEVLDAGRIRDAGAGNRMLAFPYTKLHNTQWNVDQAAALILCSVARAEALGISRDRWVFPLAAAESNHMVNTSQRPKLHRSPGARLAGAAALGLAGLGIDEVDLLELYSCFPSAVRIFARELGVAQGRALTVTGSMAYAGGPLNNYVLQATVRMAQLLRRGQGRNGLVSSVSGMLTKQGVGLWGREPNPRGFAAIDVTPKVRTEQAPLPLLEPVPGVVASIAGYTVLFDGDTPARAVAVCDVSGGRTVVYSDDPSLMEAMMREEWVGREVKVDEGARFRAEA